MYRTLMLSTVTAMGILVPASMPSQAEAKGGISIQIGYSSGYSKVGGYIGQPAFYQPAYRPVYQPQIVVPHVHGCFKVMYRTCVDEPWACYRTLECYDTALRLCERLRYSGYEAFVSGHRH
jgi:hypothetical protein